MLLSLHLEPRWSAPAEAALVGARLPPWTARVEVLGPLPTMFLSEGRAEVLHPVVQGARPARPAPLVAVVWIAQEVVIAVGLFRQLSHIAIVAVDRTEAPRSVSIEVQLAISRRDQLRQRFPDPAGAAEAVQRQSGRHEQPPHAWYRPQQRVRVGCHRVRMAEELHDAGLSDEGKPS